MESTTSGASDISRKYLSTCRSRGPFQGLDCRWSDARIPCMATVFDDLTSHPVAAAVAAAETELDQVAGFGFASMTRTEIADTLAALHRLQARVAALELGILPTAETHEVGAEAGATDTAAWWANQTQQPKRTAHHRVALARALDHRPRAGPGRDGRRPRLRGAGGCDRPGCRHAPGRAPPRRRGPPDRAGIRARPGRAAPAGGPDPRGRRPRDRRGPRTAAPSNARRRWPRKPAGSPSPTTATACATAGSPSRPRWERCSSRPSSQ